MFEIAASRLSVKPRFVRLERSENAPLWIEGIRFDHRLRNWRVDNPAKFGISVSLFSDILRSIRLTSPSKASVGIVVRRL